MACSTFSTAPYSSTQALFQAWAGAIHNAILACGWVQSSDTGQINFSTVAAPTTYNQVVGYAVYAMADSLQSSYPVFLKVSFGSPAGYSSTAGSTSTGSAYLCPAITVQIGTATNGAGVLSGITSTAAMISSHESYSATAYPSYYSGDTSRFALCLWPAAGTLIAQWLTIERTRDANGSNTSEGVIVYYSGRNTSNTWASYAQTLLFGASVQPSLQAHWNASMPPSGTGALGNNIYLFPVRSWGAGETNPALSMFHYASADLTNLNPVTATCWDGVARTVLPLPFSNGSTSYGGTGYLAMRWD